MDVDKQITANFNCPFRSVSDMGRLKWSSELALAKGQLQIVANGTEAVFVTEGMGTGTFALGRGQNRIEATLVGSSGKPGTWRLELSPAVLRSGSLRVVAGKVAVVTNTGVMFRLNGTTGERIVLTFESR